MATGSGVGRETGIWRFWKVEVLDRSCRLEPTDYTDVVRASRERGSAVEPLRLSEILRGLEGKWVALKGGEVVAAANNADALFKQLRSKRIRDASVLRVPTEREHEAELVGLG
jgi:hypothetical protein